MQQSQEKSLVFVVTPNQQIGFIGILKRSRNRAASAQRNYKAIALNNIEPLEWLQFPEPLQRRIAPYLGEFLSHIPPAIANELVNHITSLHPEISGVLQNLYTELEQDFIPIDHVELVQLQQRDASATALSLAGFYDLAFSVKSRSIPDENQSFISQLNVGRIPEDRVIEHDAGVFSDWNEEQRSQIDGIRVFENDHRRLAIINVNRTALETATGADLIYVDEAMKTILLIQYKMLSEQTSKGEPYFNPNSGSHNSELHRMRQIETELSTLRIEQANDEILNLRLVDGPFYFKLCDVNGLQKSSAKIARGMYIPLAFWEKFLSSSDTDGPSGGKQFGYHKLKHKYIHASGFVQLFEQGLIGSQSCEWSQLSSVIESVLQNGRSATVAIQTNIQHMASESYSEEDCEI